MLEAVEHWDGYSTMNCIITLLLYPYLLLFASHFGVSTFVSPLFDISSPPIFLKSYSFDSIFFYTCLLVCLVYNFQDVRLFFLLIIKFCVLFRFNLLCNFLFLITRKYLILENKDYLVYWLRLSLKYFSNCDIFYRETHLFFCP